MYWCSNRSDYVLKNSIARALRPAVNYFQTKRNNAISWMGKNILFNSINIGLAIRIYRKKAVMLETELLHLQQYSITSSTVTSHKSQLIKIFYVTRNLASCELLPCSGLGVDGVMMESSSWGVLLTFLGVDGFFPSRVTIRVLPCGSAVVSAHLLPVFCPFCSLFFLLYVIPFLSDWIFPEVMSFGGFFWIALVWTVMLRLLCPSSSLTYFGLWYLIAWCLVMTVLCRIPLLSRKPLFIWLGMAVCCLRLVAWSLTSLYGVGVISGVICLGCVLSVILASWLCCLRTMFLLFPLLLALKARVVLVCWGLA